MYGTCLSISATTACRVVFQAYKGKCTVRYHGDDPPCPAPDQLDKPGVSSLFYSQSPLSSVHYLIMAAAADTHQSLHQEAVKRQLQTAPVDMSEPQRSCRSGSVPPSTSDS